MKAKKIGDDIMNFRRAMLLRAMIRSLAHWQWLSDSDGDVVINGERYYCVFGEDGPIVNDRAYYAIERVLGVIS